MAFLRRGSSGISEENFNARLEREKAKSGAVTVSLAWNDPSDLDLHAKIILAKGGSAEIYYRNKNAAGGTLDVDMHARDGEEVREPVENIFWKNPPAGVYSIRAHLYKKRGTRDTAIPFRALLKRDGHDDLSKEGALEQGFMELFRFSVDDTGVFTMGRVGTELPRPKPFLTTPRVPMKATRAAKVKPVLASPRGPMKGKHFAKRLKAMKAVTKATRVSSIARGNKAKVQVYKGKKMKTTGGLKKADLTKSKRGKIVSVRKSIAGRESKWAKAMAKARAIKGYVGFKAVKRGGSFYEKAKEIMLEM